MKNRLLIGGVALLLLLVMGVTYQTTKANGYRDSGTQIVVQGDYIFYESDVVENAVMPLGSVQQSGEYSSTSTGGNLVATPQELLVNGPATLGSVVITGANTGVIHFYNATTTDITKRTDTTTPTSSLIVASIPASTAAGTYTFDVKAPIGLLMEIIGTSPTSTITYR